MQRSAGLDHLAFTVADREELDAWAARLADAAVDKISRHPPFKDFTADPPGTDVGTLDMAYGPPAISALTLRAIRPTSAPHPEPLGSNCVADQRDLLGRVRAGVFRAGGGRDRCTAFVRSSAASATTRSVAVEMRDHRVKLPRVAIQATRPKARATA